MPLTDAELYDRIRRTVPNKHELQVLESFLIFNKYVHPNQCLIPTVLIWDQARLKDELLPADEGRALVPPCAGLPARGRVPEKAVWHVLRDW